MIIPNLESMDMKSTNNMMKRSSTTGPLAFAMAADFASMSIYELGEAADALVAMHQIFGSFDLRSTRPGNTALRDWSESADASAFEQIEAIAEELKSRSVDSTVNDRDLILARIWHLLLDPGFEVTVAGGGQDA